MTLHGAPSRQFVALPDWLRVFNRIEHLRRQRIAFAQQCPLVGAAARWSAHSISGYQFAECVRVRSIGERNDGLVLVDLARRLHVFRLLGANGARGAQQNDTRLFAHSIYNGTEMMRKTFGVIVGAGFKAHVNLLFQRVVEKNA